MAKRKSALDEADSQRRWLDSVSVYPPECDELLTDKGKDMIAVQNILFKPGRVLATPGAIEALERSGQSVWHFLTRHLSGDWGVVDTDDKAANDDALRDGSRILSAYLLDGDGVAEEATKIWLLTEAADESGNRVATTALLPEEY